jgi:hypothetical protein
MDETPDSKDEVKGMYHHGVAMVATSHHSSGHGGGHHGSQQHSMVTTMPQQMVPVTGHHYQQQTQHHQQQATSMMTIPAPLPTSLPTTGGKAHMIERPFVYGSAAFFLGKTSEEYSHK